MQNKILHNQRTATCDSNQGFVGPYRLTYGSFKGAVLKYYLINPRARNVATRIRSNCSRLFVCPLWPCLTQSVTKTQQLDYWGIHIPFFGLFGKFLKIRGCVLECTHFFCLHLRLGTLLKWADMQENHITQTSLRYWPKQTHLLTLKTFYLHILFKNSSLTINSSGTKSLILTGNISNKIEKTTREHLDETSAN